MLFRFIITLVLTILDSIIGTRSGYSGLGVLSDIFSLAILIPSIAVSVRRLHNMDRTGWWVLISLVPVIGTIMLFIFAVLDGTPGGNRFGPNPKEASARVA